MVPGRPDRPWVLSSSLILSVILELSIMDRQTQLNVVPATILDRKIIKRRSEPVAQLLIKWSHLSDSDATLEDYLYLKK
jgi:hypothetical protein